MKKLLITGIMTVTLFTMSGCDSKFLPESIQNKIDQKIDDVKSKAMEEFEEALSEQIKDFISSTDLKETLGLTEQEAQNVQGSLKEYLENYDSDLSDWKNSYNAIQEALGELKENSGLDNLTAKELNDKLEEILSGQK